MREHGHDPGALSDTVHHPELREFAAALPAMADTVKPISDDRRTAIDALAAELERVKWAGPEGMQIERFWPLGHDGRPRWPFTGRADRFFVVSPFVTKGAWAEAAGSGPCASLGTLGN